MTEVCLRGITKHYGAHLALPPLDLEIPKGQFVTLLGPSGCGKTTTLRIIAGLETPSGGTLSLGGRTMFSEAGGENVPPEKRGLGFIFQSYALWPNMKVDRNVTLALRQSKLPGAEISARLAEALEKVQLAGMEDRFPSELSGGQQQRVAVARLIAARNSILLMDEPLSNLDAVLRTEMRTELKRMSRDLGATTIYVTHDQVEALTMSDLVVVMKDGRIQQAGSPSEIYHRPANLFVAEFIGDPKVNLFQAELRRDGSRMRLAGEGLDMEVDLPRGTAPGKVTAAIRPEHLRISDRPGPGAMEAAIDVVQPTGSQTIVTLRQGGRLLTCLVSRFLEAWPQEQVWVDAQPGHVMLFDRETGQALAAGPGPVAVAAE
ncbi:ABC transporter ATP-binding protein [Poseidonocella sp. HB161398]|uniref:ABC transporter ATP-binding protein n=1 Tax=Poseidonocella sp. HB161398 TaxID=2320855 RepID=UPI001108E481|nr:ABC transporter ATP-binding protein [Poseidonocella sp. HB161398]